MKIKLAIAAIVSLFILSGCDGTVQRAEETVDLKNVPGFEDCTFTKIDPGGVLPIVNAIRCPNSSTTSTYQAGKVKASVTVVDTVVVNGVEYAPKAKK